MLSVRLACLMIALPLLLWQGVRPALAQQAKVRKVFTNEDVARPAPSAPATAELAAEPSQAASVPVGDSTEAVPDSVKEAIPTPPLGFSIKMARELQYTLQQYLGKYSFNLEEETEPTRQERLRKMITSLMSLMQVNEQFISELESEVPKTAEEAPVSTQ